MSNHFIFNEPGSIPGVPGTFAGCQVNILEDGTVDIQPLAQHPHFVPSLSSSSEVPSSEKEEGKKKEEEKPQQSQQATQAEPPINKQEEGGKS